MRRPLVLLVSLVLALAGLVGTDAVASADECQYVSDCDGLPTKVSATGPTTVVVGERAPMTVVVKNRGAVRSTGTITVTYRHRSDETLQVVRRYRGRSIVVRGPRLGLRGPWRVTVRFERDDASLGTQVVRKVRVTKR